NANDPGGASYNAGNVWGDAHGFLHLRIAREKDQWRSAEVALSRSLGYGLYRFVVRDISHLEPAAVFAIFTWDDLGPSREMDIEISRWGNPEEKNAQYVIQPYVIPANTMRFAAPAGPLTYSIAWEPGRVSFKTTRGNQSNNSSNIVAQHTFTSGVPSAGNEKIHMNLWVYSNNRHPLQHEFEVVVESFEFLP
ncbi:MAG: glycoside hydrolase family 16 protein, partial [Acidobacteriia bacterium]|nr:glycoside hydrolase family 16 protein [Terriglobia bacterium]MBV8905587.1 glycoside hydrolase family 16 protein [Terriglobia bacterium]